MFREADQDEKRDGRIKTKKKKRKNQKEVICLTAFQLCY
jgi:hypothetical protein